MVALSAILAVMLSVPSATRADAKTDVKTELAKWQGTWEVELHLADGQEKPLKDQTISKVVVKDDVWEVHIKGRDEPAKGTIKIVLDGKIKGLDVSVDTSVFRGIYLIDGDRAVLRVGDSNDPRPEDFSTSVGSKTGAIMIYKRVKK